MKEFLEKLGLMAQRFINVSGQMVIMLAQSVYYLFIPPYKLRNIFKQMEFVGVKSLFVVILTALLQGWFLQCKAITP